MQRLAYCNGSGGIATEIDSVLLKLPLKDTVCNMTGGFGKAVHIIHIPTGYCIASVPRVREVVKAFYASQWVLNADHTAFNVTYGKVKSVFRPKLRYEVSECLNDGV